MFLGLGLFIGLILVVWFCFVFFCFCFVGIRSWDIVCCCFRVCGLLVWFGLLNLYVLDMWVKYRCLCFPL